MVFFILFKFEKKLLYGNSVEPDQTPRFNLVLLCLPMSHKKDARLIWVNRLNSSLEVHVLSLCCFAQ